MDKRNTNIKVCLFDIDGTIAIDGKPISGVKETLDYLRQSKKVYFLTNNSSVSSQDFFKKLKKIGIATRKEEVLSSADATVYYIKKHYADKKVFLIGTPSLIRQFRKNKIRLTSSSPDIVVLSFDRTCTYNKLNQASKFIRTGAKYIATHSDLLCPNRPHYDLDIGGSISLLYTCIGKYPDIVIGKPNKIMAEFIRSITKTPASQTLMVGDRLYTDFEFAKNNKFKSAVVLTGEANLENIKRLKTAPDFVLDDISQLKGKI